MSQTGVTDNNSGDNPPHRLQLTDYRPKTEEPISSAQLPWIVGLVNTAVLVALVIDWGNAWIIGVAVLGVFISALVNTAL
jgi:hypothetical protein